MSLISLRHTWEKPNHPDLSTFLPGNRSPLYKKCVMIMRLPTQTGADRYAEGSSQELSRGDKVHVRKLLAIQSYAKETERRQSNELV